MNFKTIKSAKDDGYEEIKAYEYGGNQITVKNHLLAKNPKRAKSKTEWLREGFIVTHVEPYATRYTHAHGKKQYYDVYRDDQVSKL